MAAILSETSNFKKHKTADFSELEFRKGDQINFKRKNIPVRCKVLAEKKVKRDK